MNRLGLAAQDGSTPPTLTARGLSLVELAIGSFIVVGHNVFHIVPNEVPILFVLGILSIRVREGNWRAIGLARPKSWGQTVAIAAGTAAVVILVGQFVSDPLAHMLRLHAHAGAAASALGVMKGNLRNAAKGLALVWTFAAFGEEISYRRYLLGRAADLGNRSAAAYWIGLIYVSALFGIGHFYQGPAGIFSTAVDGFIIGAAYLLSRRNLWVAVLTHGLVDTFAIVLLFFGLAN